MELLDRRPASFVFAITLLLAVCLPATASEITTLPNGVKTGGQFSVEYEERDVAPEYDWLFERLSEDRLFERLIVPLNVALHLPADIPVIIKDCDMINAYFDINNNEIVYCNEFIADIARKFETVYKTQDEVYTGLVGTVVFIFFHELGHALVTNLDLPITGRQEDAVDQLALFTMLFDQNPRDIALLIQAIAYWGIYAEWEASVVLQEDGSAKQDLATIVFADEHSMGFQRFYNTLCWAYGSNVESNKAIVESGYLPEDRVPGCEAEYDLLADAWSRMIGIYLQGDNAVPLLKEPGGDGEIIIAYEDVGSSAPLVTLMQRNQIVESIVSPLSNSLIIPSDLTINVSACKEAGISYDAPSSTINLCQGLIKDISAALATRYPNDFEKVTEGVIGTTLFFIYHQIGVALIDQLSLPVTGIPADAIDQLAVYLLTLDTSGQTAPFLLATADYFGAKSSQQLEAGNIESIYSELTGQRFYNVMCWAYGSGQDAYEDFADSGLLPEARAVRCGAEYDLLSSSWQRIIGPYFAMTQ